jgi:hypothetical protein
MNSVRPIVLACASLLALSLGRSPLHAADDPYAINPFRVAYRTAPADPALRWAGFQSRVGTYLPTDQYHWWRFDVTDRAEVQDAFWNVESVADVTLPDWTGSRPVTPGEIKQDYRDAFMRVLNLQRYFYLGADATYLAEDTDSTRRRGVQAAALIEDERLGGYRHTLSAVDFPVGFPDTDLATFYAYQGNIGAVLYPSDVTGYLVDYANAWPGHRYSLLNPAADLFAFGRVGQNGGTQNLNNYGTAVCFATDTTTMHQSGPDAGDLNMATVPPPPQYDPFTRTRVYPYMGYITIDDVWRAGNDMPFGLEFPCGGLILDGSAAQVTVTRDGVPVSVSKAGVGFSDSWRQTYQFTPALGTIYEKRYVETTGGTYHDTVVTVTVTGLKFSTTEADTASGRQADMAPYIAQSDQRAFQPHTISWSFTVFDPLSVQPVSQPGSKSELSNLSTRAVIGSGNNVMIAGFIVTGNEPLRVAIRAQGPTLAQFGIQHPAIDPQIEIYQQGTPNVVLGSNDSWKNGTNWRLLQSYGLNPLDDREAAAVATLMPGSYTAIVSDRGSGGLGVGIVEVFAIDTASRSRLVNVSTRASVGTGENMLIGGFYLQKEATVVVRTQGPTLARYGLDALTGTKLTIVRQSDRATLATNDGWNSPRATGNARLSTDLAGYAPLDSREAAQVITLQPGAYTALVESADGNPGIGIVEVFNVQ